MQDIYEQLKNAVNPGHPSYASFLLDEDKIIASDGDLGVSLPFKSGVNFIVDAALVGKAIKSTRDGEVVFSSEPFAATWTRGKRTVTVAGADPIIYGKVGVFAAEEKQSTKPEWLEIAPNVIDYICRASEVMADDQSRVWAMAVSIYNGRVMATDGNTMFYTDTQFTATINVPKRMVDFIKDSKSIHYPTHYAMAETYIAFKFESGLEASILRNADERPESLYYVSEGWTEPEFEVTPQLVDAIESAGVIADHLITLTTDEVEAKTTGADFSEEISTGVSPDDRVLVDKTRLLGLINKASKVNWGDPLSFLLNDGTKVLQSRRGR